jgi:hypothetical protein
MKIDKETLSKITFLIKNNKLNFEYKMVPIDTFHKIIPLEILDEEGNPGFNGSIYNSKYDGIGFAKVSNLAITQHVEYKKRKFKIWYRIYGEIDKINKLVSLPNANFKLLKIKELIKAWQHGTDFFNSVKSDRVLYMIDYIGVPEEFKQCKKPLYRGVNLSPPAIKKIFKNKSISLQDRKFSSWSTDKNRAIEFVGRDNDIQGILLEFSPTKEVLINVPFFLKKVFKEPLTLDYNMEKEVILKNSPKMLIAAPEQFIFTKKTVDSLELKSKLNREFLNVNIRARLL